VGAIVVLPSGTPAAAPGAYALVVDSDSPTLATLNVSIQRDASGDSVFDIQSTAPAPIVLEGSPTPSTVRVDLSYPSDSSYSCVRPARCRSLGRDYLQLRVTLANDHGGSTATVDSFARVVFHGPPLGFNSDDTAATAELPAVQVALDQQFLIGAVEVHYTIPHASSYDWTTGPRPVSTTGDRLTWYLSMQSQSSVVGSLYQSVASSAGGVDQSALQHQQILIFLAGALIGLAGGALIGSLQEFLDARAEARRTREGEGVESS
jgi:hypothetical protein